MWRNSLSLAVLAIGSLYLLSVVAQSESRQLVRDEEVILDLLRNGEMDLSEDVAKKMNLKESILQIRRIGLQKDGQEIRAAFRNVVLNMRYEGSRDKYHDAYYNESAAYVISKYLGLNIVPATVLRDLPIARHGLKRDKKVRRGSLQHWVENSVVWFDFLEAKETYQGDHVLRNHQLREIKVFDCIIGNMDRHAGNLLLDLNERWPNPTVPATDTKPYLGKIWAIDHSRAFPQRYQLDYRHCNLKKIDNKPASLAFIQRLRSWDIVDVERELRTAGHSESQLDNLYLKSIDRRAKLVLEHLNTEQAKRNLSDEEFYSSGAWHEVW